MSPVDRNLITQRHFLSRRRFLSKAAAASLGTVCAPCFAAAVAPRASDLMDQASDLMLVHRANRATSASDLTALTAVEAVRALHRGDISAESYASALLRRCEAGKSLNAFITLRPELVLEFARECDRRRLSGATLGPLHGLPIPIKDSVNTRDLETTAGTPALRHFRPREDAPLVKALRDAGAIVLGKTNLHELSYGYTSNNHAFGAVHNPYDPSRVPGGSSGGSGASIA